MKRTTNQQVANESSHIKVSFVRFPIDAGIDPPASPLQHRFLIQKQYDEKGVRTNI